MRRVVAGGVAAGLGIAAAAGGSLARVVPVGASTSCSPHVDSVSPQHGPVGQVIQINGSGFSCGNLSASIDGTSLTVTPNSASPDAQIAVTTNRRLNGPVQVTGSGVLQNPPPSNSNLQFLTDPSSNAPNGWTNAAPGQQLALSGNGFSLAGSSGSHANAVQVRFVTTQAGVCPSPVIPRPGSDTTVTFSAPGQYCDGTVVLSVLAQGDTNSSSNNISIPLNTPQRLVVQPSGSASSAADVPAGSTVHVTGSGFGTSGTVTLAGAAVPSSWTDRDVAVTVPDPATSGQLAVTRGDGVSVYTGALAVDARADTVSPSTASVGDTVTISGGGFGSNPGTLTLGSVSPAPASWSPTSISFVVPAEAQSGPIQIQPKDTNPPASAPSLTLQARLGSISPSHSLGGNFIQINGTGFGSTKGTVTLSGSSVAVTVWGDTQVVIYLPATAAPGHHTLVVTPPGDSPASAPFTVDVPPPSSSATTTGSSSSSSSSSSSGSPTPSPGIGIPPLVNGLIPPGANGPIISHGPVNFTKPARPSTPVNLTLATAADSADPGQDIPFTVTLIAFGKPVGGALVDLSVIVEPGTDARVTPSQAKTDAGGRVSGVVHLSRTAGDHIILARSGSTSDEVRLVGRGAQTDQSSGGGLTSVTDVFTSGPSKTLLLGATAGCLVLFLTGFGIQMILPRRARSTAAAGTVVVGTQCSLLGRMARFPEAVAVVAQYALMALIVVPAQLVARVVR